MVPFTDRGGRRRPMTNSERGKAFRARHKKFITQLEVEVTRLRTHVADLQLTRSVVQNDRLLNNAPRYSPSGPLAGLIHEYFSLFQHGLQTAMLDASASPISDSSDEQTAHREGFLRRILDDQVQVGEYQGPAAAINQWRWYSASHDNLQCEIVSVTAYGTEDHPIVEVLTKMIGVISNDTFRILFPGASDNEDLKQRFLGKQVTYSCRHMYEFTTDNKVAVERAEIDFIRGLQEANCGLMDIAELMSHCIVTPQGVIPDATATPSTAALQAPANSKLCVEFLLAD